MPKTTLFDLLTRKEVEDFLENGFDSVQGIFTEGCKTKLLEEARQRLKKKESPTGTERIKPREHILISDKSLADSGEALIGVFLARLVLILI